MWMEFLKVATHFISLVLYIAIITERKGTVTAKMYHGFIVFEKDNN